MLRTILVKFPPRCGRYDKEVRCINKADGWMISPEHEVLKEVCYSCAQVVAETFSEEVGEEWIFARGFLSNRDDSPFRYIDVDVDLA